MRVEQRYYYGRTTAEAQLAGRADYETMVGLGYRFVRQEWQPARSRSTRVLLFGFIGFLGSDKGRLTVTYQHEGPGIGPEPPPGVTAPGLRMVHLAIGIAAVAIVVIIVLGLATGGP